MNSACHIMTHCIAYFKKNLSYFYFLDLSNKLLFIFCINLHLIFRKEKGGILIYENDKIFLYIIVHMKKYDFFLDADREYQI